MARDFSIDTGEIRKLGNVDYILFSLLFVFSAAIGFYHAYKDRHQTSADSFHLSGRKMHPIPVSMSLTATFMSALTLLGNPTEIYTNGTMFYWIVAAMFIATISTNYLFLPVFYNLGKTSCFEYIQMRFGPEVRALSCVIYIIATLVYMGFVLYAPCLAFQAVTNLSLWGTMVGASFVCTLYTTLGGLKTVLWTDSLQLTVMLAGLVAVLAESSRITGGFAKAWAIAAENGRIEFLNFSPDPRTRHTVWSLAIGASFFWTNLYGLNQAQIQRACSLPTLRQARIAVWLNFPGLLLIISLTCMIGITMFAFYKDCDPFKSGLVGKADQMLPLMVLDVLGDIPGITGLFVACVFSGSLSSISSGLNAMSAVLLEDFVKPIHGKALNGKTQILLSKLFVVVLGVSQFGVAALISQSSGLILQLSYSVTSILGAPLMGLFLSGLVFPWVNKYGAIVGTITSLALLGWVALGAAIERPTGTTSPLSVSVTGCHQTTPNATFVNITTVSQTTTVAMTTPDILEPVSGKEPAFYNFYRMSYQWYTVFAVFVHVAVALVVSFLTGRIDPKTINPKLMIPLFYKLFPCLPEKYRRHLRLGVNYDIKEDSKNDIPVKGLDNTAYAEDVSLSKA